ncbi:MFS transporter [Novosphingobium sp. YJ-S2-02]|uniref:MFS transporter n=1 Tax=Novosphingobium aureum TaxID=2792964 RepID=A0A931HE34_9SPHN|nr:MFS transporter [Novosphingobium aureum]MBH0114079.1 MFS transporter [Novosphingobium aureum]
MSETTTTGIPEGGQQADTARWSAVYAMALCSFVLVASEFMPVSLLSPMASSLTLTEGEAGQTIAASGLFAVIASLSIGRVTRAFQRQKVLVALSIMLIASSVLTAIAPNYPLLMVGRAAVGIAIGGFWSMSAAIALRLVPAGDVAKALAVINGGNAAAMALAAPLGSLLGGLIGWRGAFWSLVPLGIAASLWLALALPRMHPESRAARRGLSHLMRHAPLSAGLASVALLFIGQFSLFTYLRPFLEQVTGVGVSLLSTLLLVLGVSGFFGTIAIGKCVERRLFSLLGLLPAVLAVVALALASFGAMLPVTVALLAIWGFIATAAPVAWWTWLARTVPHDAEAGGGLMVAVIQIAITLGATLGGISFDAVGPVTSFFVSAAILALAAAAAFVLGRLPFLRIALNDGCDARH